MDSASKENLIGDPASEFGLKKLGATKLGAAEERGSSLGFGGARNSLERSIRNVSTTIAKDSRIVPLISGSANRFNRILEEPLASKATNRRKSFTITPQPDDATCGPACLHALYRYWNIDISLDRVLDEVRRIPDGGTFAVNLALHAMENGFNSTIYTSNLQLFDPTWFDDHTGADKDGTRVRTGIEQQMLAKEDPKLGLASQAYLDYLDLGGKIHMEDISFDLIANMVSRDCPLIVGLSCTWLYRCARETVNHGPDDIRGESTGHFVVVYDVDREKGEFKVADPYGDHPFSDEHCYSVGASRLIGAIMLGIVTYDAKLLLLTPKV